MEHRFASLKINGEIVTGLFEKHCGLSCPCAKGGTSPATLVLTNFAPECSLQRIPSLVEGLLIPQIRNRIATLSTVDFEAYCKKEREMHFTEADKSIRVLANPCNTFEHKTLIHKLWNEQAVKVYSQALAANAVDGNAIALADARTETIKTMRQVALLYIYQNAPILHAQASAIAEKYGFSSPTSGQKLYSTYNKLAHQTAARTGVASKGLRLMINDIIAVLPHLTENGRQQAEKEIQTLKAQK